MTHAPADLRRIVRSGILLGGLTALGVTVFALVSRAVDGTLEVVLQSAIIFVGGVTAAYLPAIRLQPRNIDDAGWCALVAVIGAATFTAIDTAILRPVGLYHWTWDAIGGGSGWWYLPVWFMGAAFLAWIGTLVYGRTRRFTEPRLAALAGPTVGLAAVILAGLALTGITPFHAGPAALAFTLGLLVQLPISVMLARR